MRKRIIYAISIIISFLIGCSLMYGVLYFLPINTVKTVNTNNVTVTDKGISQGVNNIKNSIVVVKVYKNGQLITFGSGFVYKTKGDIAYIMTNHHVIEEIGQIKISIPNIENEIDATLIGSEQYADIAVLSVPKENVTQVATIGKSEETLVGDTVFTIGCPIDVNFAGTVTRGILSGKNRLVNVSVGSTNTNDWIMNVMQTDASINPGNSGGPLCNVNGEVIGINSLKIVQDEVEGLGFSIPIEDALYYANKLETGEKIARPYIGISMLDVTSSYGLSVEGIRLDSSIHEGVVISSIEENSPAFSSNLAKGDVIVSINGISIKNIAEFRYYLYKNEPGEIIELKIFRNGNYKECTVKLTSN